MPGTHFDILGLPQRFALDAAAIEANYLRRSRELHPDYHQQAAASEQRASMELTAALNDAYATLRDPFRRAEYLLALSGGPSASELRDMPSDFLEEMLELRMEIEELRERGDNTTIAAMEKQLQARRADLVDRIGERFAEHDRSADDARRGAVRIEVRRLLNAAKYIQGQLRDLRAD